MKLKRALLLFLLLIVVVAAAAAATAAIEAEQFRVVQLNAWNADDGKEWPLRTALIAELIGGLRADCVAFEEVRITPARSMLADLRAALGAELPFWAYAKASEIDGGEEGIAIACRWPFAGGNATTTTMPPQSGCYDPLTRAALHVAVQAASGALPPVDVIVTHWSYAPCNQAANADATLEFASRVSAAPALVLLGDFNAYEEANAALARLVRPLAVAVSGTPSQFVDAWRALHPDARREPGFTFSSLQAKGGLHNRCDRVFVAGNGVEIANVSVLCNSFSGDDEDEENATTAGESGGEDDDEDFDASAAAVEDTLHPSDHCAVVVTILLSSSSSSSEQQKQKQQIPNTRALSSPTAGFVVAGISLATCICVVLLTMQFLRRRKR